MKKRQLIDEATFVSRTGGQADKLEKSLGTNRLGINLGIDLAITKKTSKRKVFSPMASRGLKRIEKKESDQFYSSTISVANQSESYSDSGAKAYDKGVCQQKLMSKINELEIQIEAFTNEHVEFKKMFKDSKKSATRTNPKHGKAK